MIKSKRVRVNQGVATLVVLLLASTMVAACNGGGGSEGGGSDGSGGAGPITLAVPSDWSSEGRDDGLVTALEPDDLGAEVPSGPRVSVTYPSAPLPDVDEVAEAVEDPGSGFEVTRVLDGPDSMTVGGVEGAALTVEERHDGVLVTTRYVVVNRGDGAVFEFRLQAPSERWDEHAGTMEGVLAGATFAP